MSILNKIIRKIAGFFLMIRNKILNVYYAHFQPSYGLNQNESRNIKIIVSLTSYPKRFKTLCIGLKSIFNQTVLPDKIILYLDDTVDDNEILPELKEMQKYGLEIVKRPENIKPHKKYFYAMKEYPDDIIITVDDDAIYNRYLIEKLMNSYRKYPKCVSAVRVHKIAFDEKKQVKNYNDWLWDCKNINLPSMQLFATGVAGVLYPPHCMNEEVLNLENIKKLSLNNDDIWLKFMQMLSKTLIVRVPCSIHACVDNSQEISLNSTNVLKNTNDIYIENLTNYYKIDLYGEICE